MRIRRSVRGILVAGIDRERSDPLAQAKVLLMAMDFPWHDGPQWITPGGGIEAEESPLDALRRELFEETGFRLETTPTQIGTGSEPYPDAGITLDHRFFLIPSPLFTPRALALEPREAGWFQSSAWHALTALDGLDLLPTNLATGIRSAVVDNITDFKFA
ncbi:MAG: NUDIX hydrolase [Pseudomonadota bacterium]